MEFRELHLGLESNKALAPCSHPDVVCSVCKGAGIERALPVDSLAQNVPRNSSAASEGYCGNGTNIIASSHAAGLHFAKGKIFHYFFVTALSDW